MTIVEEVRKVAEKSFLRVVLGPKEGLRHLHLKSEDNDAEGQSFEFDGRAKSRHNIFGQRCDEMDAPRGSCGVEVMTPGVVAGRPCSIRK